MSAKTKALSLLGTLGSLLAEEPTTARTTAMTNTMCAVVEAVGEVAILPLWAQCLSSDDATVRRTLSYVLARHSESLGNWNWIPLLWLVNSPGSNDESGILNTLTTIQCHLIATGTPLAALRSQVAPFLVDAISRSEVARESAIEAIDTLAESGALRKLLTKADAEQLSELLAAARQDTDEEGVALIEGAIETLSSTHYSVKFPDGADAIRAWLAEHPPTKVKDKDKWSETIAAAETVGVDYVTRDAAFDSFAGPVESRFAAYDLHVSKHWADEGRVPFEFLQRLLSTWQRLYFSVRESIAPGAPEPSMFVLAPAPGSFTTRLLVEPPADKQETEEAVASELSSRLAGLTGRGEPVPEKQGAEYASLLELVSQHDVSFEIGVASSLRYRVRARVLISAPRAKAAVASIRRPSPRAGEEVTLDGMLDAANHRSGHFEIVPDDGSGPIKGVLRAANRSILLGRTIGQRYTFWLLREGAGDSPKWTLLKLRRLGPTMVEEDVPPLPAAPSHQEQSLPRPGKPRKGHKAAAAPPPPAAGARPLPPIPKKLDSRAVPQVDNLSGMIQVVEILAAGRELSAEELEVSPAHKGRAVGYVKQAARVLHLIDDSGALTSEGAALAGLPSEGKRVKLFTQLFESSLVGRAWMAWAKVTSVLDLDPETANEFLRAKKLKPSMITRRGRTLRRWVTDLQAGKLQPLHHRE